MVILSLDDGTVIQILFAWNTSCRWNLRSLFLSWVKSFHRIAESILLLPGVLLLRGRACKFYPVTTQPPLSTQRPLNSQLFACVNFLFNHVLLERFGFFHFRLSCFLFFLIGLCIFWVSRCLLDKTVCWMFEEIFRKFISWSIKRTRGIFLFSFNWIGR